MAVLPDVLGCRPLRRTVQVFLGTNTLRLPGGTPILFALAPLRSVPQAGSQFRGLATGIHEISGIVVFPVNSFWGYYKQICRNGLAEWLCLCMEQGANRVRIFYSMDHAANTVSPILDAKIFFE